MVFLIFRKLFNFVNRYGCSKRLATTENKLGQNIAVCSDKNLASSVLNNKVPSKIELFDCRIYN